MRPPVPPGPWLVVGLARSGTAAGRALRARGEEVVGVDARGVPGGLPFAARVGDGVALLDAVAAVVKSPGVPPRAPAVAEARARGLPVLGEVELAWRMRPDVVFAGVTGTNGKTTATEWLAHVGRLAGADVHAAGNVGTAVSSLVGDLAPGATVVCECSSYQLHDTLAFRPEVGVLLNLESDHLDWHGDAASYRDAKLTGMFSRQTGGDVAVVPAAIEVPGGGRRHEWTREPVSDVGPAGAHNLANARAVAAAARELGWPEDAIAEGLRSFAGVAHRLEPAGDLEGVRYVNDSKATNVASTLVALAAMTSPLHLIAGGDDAKGEDFSPLRVPVRARCESVHLIGQSARRMRDQLGTGELDGTLERALEAAAARARPGDVVLLSPACASFDQFDDFEARGERFKELVAARRRDA